MRRPPNHPLPSDFIVTAQYRYGILKFTAVLDSDVDALWLHSVNVQLVGTGDVTDRFSFDIDAPIRMNPGGRTTDHWRPRAIDLEDASVQRPSISVEIVAARKRRNPVAFAPAVWVDDGFEVLDGEFHLIPTSEFAKEIERNRKLRMDGLATREG